MNKLCFGDDLRILREMGSTPATLLTVVGGYRTGKPTPTLYIIVPAELSEERNFSYKVRYGNPSSLLEKTENKEEPQ